MLVGMDGNAYSPFLGPDAGSLSTPDGMIQVEGPGGVREAEGGQAAAEVIALANAAARVQSYGAESPEGMAAVSNAASVLGLGSVSQVIPGGAGGGEFSAPAGKSSGAIVLVLAVAAVLFFARK